MIAVFLMWSIQVAVAQELQSGQPNTQPIYQPSRYERALLHQEVRSILNEIEAANGDNEVVPDFSVMLRRPAGEESKAGAETLQKLPENLGAPNSSDLNPTANPIAPEEAPSASHPQLPGPASERRVEIQLVRKPAEQTKRHLLRDQADDESDVTENMQNLNTPLDPCPLESSQSDPSSRDCSLVGTWDSPKVGP